MSEDKLISELKLSTNELKQLILFTVDKKNMTSETETKKANLISSIVNYFYQILSFLFQNGKNYWEFISKHVNGPVTTFCLIYEKNDFSEQENNIEDHEQKGKYWIFFNILENSFLGCMKLIIDYLEENEECKNNNTKKFLVEYKKDVIIILEELNNFQLNNIIDEDYENYLNFLKRSEPENKSEIKLFNLSPILKNKKLQKNNSKEKENYLFSFFEGLSSKEYPEGNHLNESIKDINLILDIEIKEPSKEVKKSEEFEFQKFADFEPSIVDNFYNFIPSTKSNIKSLYEEDKNSNVIINPSNEDVFLFKGEDLRRNSGLILNTEIKDRNLPSDKLYEIQGNNYAKNDEFLYNKKKKKISNSLLLYLTNFYQKARYYKFYVRNTHKKSISLKEQNYQCFICLNKFNTFLGFPIEQIYWCSYYMRFVCKNCIADDYSIIPQLILKEWCFDKCPISKKAKAFINSWYDKPIIYLKKNDELLKNIPKIVLKLKKDLKNIFDFMKCDNAFDFLNKKIPDYQYIVLNEYIFSIKDLIDIHNKTFTKKLKDIKNIFIKHLNQECEKCKYEGEICLLCQNEEKIHFYDSDTVTQCKKCKRCFHKECHSLNIGHICHSQI